MKFKDKEAGFLHGLANIAGIFTIVIAITMIFSFIQLKTINPLDNPVLVSVKDQYDKDPENRVKAEQVRAMDLMARKAYFTSRRQIETGAYLLVAGAAIFLFCRWLLAGNEKLVPAFSVSKPNQLDQKGQSRNYMLITAGVVTIGAVIASFILRNDMPDPTRPIVAKERSLSGKFEFKPDDVHFPSFRGPDSRGFAGGKDYPVEWDGVSGKNIKWKTAIPKNGKSSPVIWDDRIFLTGADEKTCEVYCIDKKSGKILWTAPGSGIEGEPAELPEMDREAGLAVSTMVTNGKSVFAIFSNGNLLCLDMDGKQKWAANIGTPENSYGYSSSLLIFDDILIVQFDSNSKISLMGFDTGNGDLKWETIRPGRPVWSSPVLASFGGKPQIVINGNPNVSAYDPLTGSELWSVECMSGDVGPSVAVNSTMAYGVTDYASLVAIKPGTGASVAWEDNYFTPDVSSPVATDQFLFLTTGNGDVACYDAAKGDTLWSRFMEEPFYASPVIADEKVFMLDRSGKMHIVKASGTFELIGEPQLGERADCTPAFSDKNIYIRGRNNLYCISEN